MAIGPIPDFRPLDLVPAREVDPELPPIQRVEGSSGAAGSTSRRKQAPNRQDSDRVELAGESLPESPAPAIEDESGANINFFA